MMHVIVPRIIKFLDKSNGSNHLHFSLRTVAIKLHQVIVDRPAGVLFVDKRLALSCAAGFECMTLFGGIQA